MTFLTFHEFKIHSENNHPGNKKSPEKKNDKELKSMEVKFVESNGEEIVTLDEYGIPVSESPKNSNNKLPCDCQFCARKFDTIDKLQMHVRKDHEQLITIFEEQKKKLEKNSTEIQIVQPPKLLQRIQPKSNQLMSTQQQLPQQQKSTNSTILLKTTNQLSPSVQMATNQIQRNQTSSSHPNHSTVQILDQKVAPSTTTLQTSNDISNCGFSKSQVRQPLAEVRVEVRQENGKIEMHKYQGGPSLKFKCSLYSCEESFSNIDSFENHRKNCQKSFQKYKCELYGKTFECTKYFQSEFFINQHLQKIHADPTTIHKCHMCPFSGFKSSVLEHFDSIHAKTTTPSTNTSTGFKSSVLEQHFDSYLHAKTTSLYTCTLCNLVFPSTSSLTIHNSSAHDVRTSNNILLTNILKNNHTNQRIGSNPSSLGNNQSYHIHGNEKYHKSCHYCGLKLSDINSLSKHIERNHNNLQLSYPIPEDHYEKVSKNFRENDFTKKISDVEVLKENVNNKQPNSNENIAGQQQIAMNNTDANKSYAHKCDYCTDVFTSMGNLKTHINIFHEEEISQYMTNYCPACEESFVKSSDLNLHFVNVHGGKKAHKCFECNKMMATRSSVKQHFENVHLGIRKFNCQKCPKEFYQNRDLKKHLVDFHKFSHKYIFELEKPKPNNNTKIHEKCDFCQEVFRQEHLKKVHIERMHTNVVHGKVMKTSTVLNEKNCQQIGNNFVCKTCTLYFSNQEPLDDHIKSFHENFGRMKSKSHQCNLCDKSFDSEKNLISHINSDHSHLIKIFQCKFCSQDMEGSLLKLALHIKTIHEGQKVGGVRPTTPLQIENQSGGRGVSHISHIPNNHEKSNSKKEVITSTTPEVLQVECKRKATSNDEIIGNNAKESKISYDFFSKFFQNENSNLKNRKQHWKPCVHCQKCFNTVEELTIHVDGHKNLMGRRKSAFWRKCEFCNEMTTESEDMHMLKCNINNVEEYIMG